MYREHDKKNKKITTEWSVGEIQDLKEEDIPKVNREHDAFQENFKGKKSGNGGFDWYGVHGSVDAVRRLQEKGWPEGLKKAHEAIGKIHAPMTRAMKRIRVRGDHGDTLDMQRIYRGDFMTAWERRKRFESDGFSHSKIVRIFTNIAALCYVDAADMFWRGALATVLTEELEAIGHPVEIIGYCNSKGTYYDHDDGPDWNLHLIKIKESGTPIELEKLITVTALGGWFRVNIFNAMVRENYRAASGLGSCKQYLPEGMVKDHDIHITDVWNKEAAIEMAVKICKKLEGENALAIS